MLTNVCSWRTEKTEEHPGAQIDLLFSRADNIVNIFEMKYAKDAFTIDAKYAKELRSKISAFEIATHTKSAIHPVMVTTYGVSHNEHFNIIQRELTMDDLFT